MNKKTETPIYYFNPEDIEFFLGLIEFRFEMANLSQDHYEDRLQAEDLYVHLKRMQIDMLKGESKK
jgi:hypothetical protein